MMSTPKSSINFISFLVFLIACCRGIIAREHTVATDLGGIIGHEFYSELYDSTSVRFLGIPYAETPVRFSKSRERGNFSEAFNASAFGHSCFQDDTTPFSFGVSPVSEDCLTLNIFAPGALGGSDSKAVMVFIYGGGFIVGASKLYHGDGIALHGDVVVVTLNYRLAAFGFLDFGLSEAPGNVGLWDIHLALRWVSKHINKFGGDKSRVTIFGESAGAAAVTYQMMYKNNAGLFQRAIAESGALGNSWGSTPRENSLNLSKSLANALKCNAEDATGRLDCIRKANASQIATESTKLMANIVNKFAPTQDNDFVKYNPADCLNITSECTKQMIDVSFISGINDFEGLSYIGEISYTNPGATWKEQGVTQSDFDTIFVPNVLNYMEQKDNTIIADILKYSYTNHTSSSDVDRFYQTVNMGTDLFFLAGAFQINDINSELNRTTYVYRFGKRTIFPFVEPGPLGYGANHGDELGYVFGFSDFGASSSAINKTEMDYAKNIMTYWTNFAKTGDPNGPVDTNNTMWAEYNHETKQFMDFTPLLKDFRMESHMYADREALWMDLLPKMKAETKELYAEAECETSHATCIGASGTCSVLLLFYISRLISQVLLNY